MMAGNGALFHSGPGSGVRFEFGADLGEHVVGGEAALLARLRQRDTAAAAEIDLVTGEDARGERMLGRDLADTVGGVELSRAHRESPVGGRNSVSRAASARSDLMRAPKAARWGPGDRINI